MSDRRIAWALLAAALVLRVLMLLLPEPGRDEATYLHWTWFPRLDYAPLLQLQIFVMRLASVEPGFLRLGQLAVGLGVLVAFHSWLRARAAEHTLLSVALVATVPWLCFSGSILHPDAWLVLGLLWFALGAQRGQLWWVTCAALVCIGAKPTGIVPATIALGWLIRRRAWPQVALLATGLVGYTVLVQGSTLDAAREFARVGVSVPARLGLLALECALLGLPLLIFARARRDVAALTGGSLIIGFTLAALTTGQVKANWLLPGFLLLWPLRPRRPHLVAAGVAGLALSTLMVAGYRDPQLAESAEARLGTFAPPYRMVAGEREARMASASTWAEYLEDFHARYEWPPVPVRPDWIESDDYGVAARLALVCPAPVPRIAVTGDPLYGRPGTGRRLIVAVRIDAAELIRGGRVQWRTTRPHPVTGAPIEFLLMDDEP